MDNLSISLAKQRILISKLKQTREVLIGLEKSYTKMYLDLDEKKHLIESMIDNLDKDTI